MHYFAEYFPGGIRYFFAEYKRAYTHITSWSVEIPYQGFSFEETGLWHGVLMQRSV